MKTKTVKQVAEQKQKLVLAVKSGVKAGPSIHVRPE
jgi:hypothetical protein